MSRSIRLGAALVLVAAAGATGPAPAYAEACPTATGVTVVVDFHELGGGLQQVCDADGGEQRASALFPDNGYPLTYVQRQPGFVCRVAGTPADDPCVNTPPTNAYWGLWWSDGESGTWSYSSAGAGSLTIPEGGSVAFSWNGSATKSEPGAPPQQHETVEEPSQEPDPTSDPTTRPSRPPRSDGGGTPGGGDASTEPTPTGSASPAPERGDRMRRGADRDDASPRTPGERDRDRDPDDATEEPSADPTATPPSEAATVAEPPPTGEDSALPVWVGPAAVGSLLGVAGVATYLRRRTS